MHQLVASYLRAVPLGIDSRRLAVDALDRVLERCGYNLAAWSAQAPHLMALLENLSQHESSEATRIYTRAVRYYELSGNWKAMLSYSCQAFEMSGDNQTIPRSERLRRTLNYAESLQYQGKHLAAVEMFQQAMPLLSTVSEAESLLAEFGISAVLIGRFAAGLAAVRRALAMQQRRYRENSRSLQPQFGDHAGRMLRKLAYCLAHAGQYRAARRCAEAALPLFWNEQPLPEGDIAQTLFILGLIGNFQACHQDAERCHRESLRHRIHVYAPGQSDPCNIIHTEIGESLDGIGLALLGQGRIDEARRYLEAAFNICRQDRTGTPHDPLRYSALGMLAVASDDLPAARHYFSYAYEIINADCGPGNYWAMEARAYLGLIALRQGRRRQAEELLAEPQQHLQHNAPRQPLLARINAWLAPRDANRQPLQRATAATLTRATSSH
jgi:tetratricopeptide (TPR) repeat protein